MPKFNKKILLFSWVFWCLDSICIKRGRGARNLMGLVFALTVLSPESGFSKDSQTIPPEDLPLDTIMKQGSSNFTPEFIKNSKNFAQDTCNIAQKEFHEKVERNIPVRGTPKEFNNFAKLMQEEIPRKAAMEYDQHCLAPLPDAAKGTPEAARQALTVVLTNSMKLPIDRSLIEIPKTTKNTPQPRPFCGGLRLGPDLFVTARHCFFDKKSNKKKFTTNMIETYVRLQLLADPGHPLQVELLPNEKSMRVLSKGDPIPHTQDYVFLKAVGSRIAMPPVYFKMAKIHEPVHLAGVFPFNHLGSGVQLERGESKNHTSHPDWFSQLRTTRSGSCAILGIGSGCFQTGCQTLPGFSGMPVFSMEQPGAILGLHVAGGRQPGVCGQRIGKLVNIGIHFDKTKIPNTLQSQVDVSKTQLSDTPKIAVLHTGS